MRVEWRAAFAAATLLCGLALMGCAGAGAGAGAGPSDRLTERALRQVLDDIERDANALRLDTLRAVLANDAEISMRTTATGRPQTLRFSREEYLSQSEAVLEDLRAGGVRYESRSTPPQLRITPDGLSAVATATTLDTYRHPDGRQVDTSSRSIVHFVHRDGATLIDTIEVFDETAPVGVPPSPPDVR